MAKASTQGGIKAAIAGAQPAPAVQVLSGDPARTDLPAKGKPLPPDFPIKALGKNGLSHYFLDADKQLIELAASEMNRLNLTSMMGQYDYLLREHWPRYSRNKIIDGVKYDEVAASFMRANHGKIWDPFHRERGTGAHAGDRGEFILHCGDAIYVGPSPGAGGAGVMAPERWLNPGLINRHVYPQLAAAPRPSLERAPTGPTGPAETLRQMLLTWEWKRGDLDAQLLLGWIGCALMGGALKWRPNAWVTGGFGTGKSTLIDLLEFVFAENGILKVSNTTAAGIWQNLGHRTVPVMFDEAEPTVAAQKRMQAMLELMRQASSGGLILRGGAEHTSTQFTVRSCFLCGSILVPAMEPQDKSRIAVLQLQELKGGKPAPVIDEAKMRKLGEDLRRRVIDGWHRWPEILEGYRNALIAVGHNARGADQWGNLLAAADLLLNDQDFNQDDAENWTERLKAADLSLEHDTARDEDRCLNHLLASNIMPYGAGKPYPVDKLVSDAASKLIKGEPNEHNEALALYGIKVGVYHGRKCLLVASGHHALQQLFTNTVWLGPSGPIWNQSLQRLQGSEATHGVTIGRRKHRATAIPLDYVLPDDVTADAAAGVTDEFQERG